VGGGHLDEIAKDAIVTYFQGLDVGLGDEPGLQRGDYGAGLGGQCALGIEGRVVAFPDEAAVTME
jgi:hypothetical protein